MFLFCHELMLIISYCAEFIKLNLIRGAHEQEKTVERVYCFFGGFFSYCCDQILTA